MELSVVAPVYNKEAWVAESIESLQAQAVSEILFIDDGSTDNTAEIIKFYQKDDKRIRLVQSEKNVGLGKSWNLGHKLAKGNIILVASGDDIWVKDRAKITAEYFRRHPKTDVFYGAFYFCDSMMHPMEMKPALPFSAKKLMEKLPNGRPNQYIGHFVMAYTKKIALKVPMRNLRVGIDYPFLCDLARAKAKFGYTKEVLGFARILSTSVTQTRQGEVKIANETAI